MLQFLTWTATGLGAGWLVRTLMRSRRDFGLVGDLVTGWLGGLVGGWLFRRLDFVAPANPAGQVVVALVGAIVLLSAVRGLRELMSAAGVTTVAGLPTSASLEERLRQLTQFERAVLSRALSREHWSRDPQTYDAAATVGQRLADRVASFGGSWTFIGLFAVMMVSWMALNQEMEAPFDAYPYILLNLVLSCLAALQAPVIMMSQNRQAARDRLDARNDYEVNLRAEMEIVAVHTKLDLLREQEWSRIRGALEQQQHALTDIQTRLDTLASDGPRP
ncbi:MAG TPA: DUF1003 domain-containing protein [Vicinamibacterales bacterium]|nr:DUF1003 domain-containing protein [Vicinamibacterales bacterium]